MRTLICIGVGLLSMVVGMVALNRLGFAPDETADLEYWICWVLLLLAFALGATLTEISFKLVEAWEEARSSEE